VLPVWVLWPRSCGLPGLPIRSVCTCRQLGIEEAERQVGAELELHQEQAHRLVSAGYIEDANPYDVASVQEAMRPVKSKPAAAKPSTPGTPAS
jgi:protein-tyrosine phosphatase